MRKLQTLMVFLFLKLVVRNVAWLFYLTTRAYFRLSGKEREKREPERICLASMVAGGVMFGIGDMVMSNSIVKLIHHQFPKAKIFLLAKAEEIRKYEEFYTRHSWIDRFVPCPTLGSPPSSWLTLPFKLRKYGFDLCVLNQYSIPPLFAYLAGIPERVGYEGVFLTKKVRPPVADHTRCHWSLTARAYAEALGMGEDFDVRDLVPYIRFENETPPPLPVAGPLVAIHPGGAKNWNRRWPLAHYQSLCERLCSEEGVTIFLVGGPDETAVNDLLKAGVSKAVPEAAIHNLACGDFQKTASYLNHADLFIGNDSGPLHMAVGLGTPVIAIFGPSNFTRVGPERLDPEKHRTICLEGFCSNQAPCPRGCVLVFEDERPAYPECLRKITVDEVFHEARKRLSLSARRR